MRKTISVVCAVIGILVCGGSIASADQGGTRAARLCTDATTELRSERDHNKLNVTTCALVDGKDFRGEAVVDCFFYKGLGWFSDQPCDLRAQFLIEFRKNGATLQANKSAVLAVTKEDGLGLTATMKNPVPCPRGTTSVVVTVGASAQQYWTDYGDAEKPHGLVSHTIQRTC